jgi:hypothetical protein
MTTAAKVTFANKVYMDPAPTAAATLVAELLSITPPKQSRGMIDATTHDSIGGAEEVISEGTYDPGTMTLSVNYIARTVGDIAMTLSMTSGALQNIKLLVKTATGFESWTFSGYVTEYGPDDMPVKGKQTASLTLKVSGAITKAVSA